MSTSFPVRTRQPRLPSGPPETGSNQSPRGGTFAAVVRSILLVVAAVSVIATSNYFAYLIGRKQVTYEELRRQVDRIVQLMDQKRVEEELALTTLKQRQERLEQNASGLTGLTTSTINGKTTAREPMPAEGTTAAALIDDTTVTPPDPKVNLQPPESAVNAAAKPRDTHSVVQQRALRRPKVSPVARRKGPTEPAGQWGQVTTAILASPDAGLAGQ